MPGQQKNDFRAAYLLADVTWAERSYLARLASVLSPERLLILASDENVLSRVKFIGGLRAVLCSVNSVENLGELTRTEKLDLIIFNASKLKAAEFQDVLSKIHAAGARAVARITETFSAWQDLDYCSCWQCCDFILAEHQQTKRCLLQNGVPAEKLEWLPLLNLPLQRLERQWAKNLLALPPHEFALVLLAAQEKQTPILPELIQLLQPKERDARQVHLYFLVEGGPGGIQHARSALPHWVHLLPAEEVEVPVYAAAADAVLLLSDAVRGAAEEAAVIALQAETPVLCAGFPLLNGMEQAVLELDKADALPAALAWLGRDGHAESLTKAGTDWLTRNRNEPTWIESLNSIKKAVTASAAPAGARSSRRVEQPSPVRQVRLRVLMRNRANAYVQRGGDTVLMERLAQSLRALGHTVDIDLQGRANVKEYDLVHLFNFVTNQVTQNFAERCVEAQVPYVVTALNEDWPVFFNQMAAYFTALKCYVESNQRPELWPQLAAAATSVEPCRFIDNSWTAKHAAALFATGQAEAQTLARHYPGARVEVIHLGHEVVDFDDHGEMFERQYGMRNFVLSVARIELRKNQLMLLKALEDWPYPVVLAGGGFTYQPEYEELCRKFRRSGRTIVLPYLEPKMLASAFAAAKVHALPSWFELPGLVSLEAAHYGANIVAANQGTLPDYLGAFVKYCAPDSPESIRNAVLTAYDTAKSDEGKRLAAEFTWDRTARETSRLYLSVLAQDTAPEEEAQEEEAAGEKDLESMLRLSLEKMAAEAQGASRSVEKIPEVVTTPAETAKSAETSSLVSLCEAGDEQVFRGKFEEAAVFYREALLLDSKSVRAMRALGIVALQQDKLVEAETRFRDALRIDEKDAKSLLGLGTVFWQRGDKANGFEIYLKAFAANPKEKSAILHIIGPAYELKRLSELENVLKRYLKEDPLDLDIQYCLAGCFFSQQKYPRASGIVEHILNIKPDYEKATELRRELEQAAATKLPPQAIQPASPAAAEPETPDETAKREFESLSNPPARLVCLDRWKKEKRFQLVLELIPRILDDAESSDREIALGRIIKGECLGSIGQTLEADLEFAATETDPLYGYRALTGRGAIAAWLQRWHEAAAFFKRAVMIKPDHDAALAGLGICASNTSSAQTAWDWYIKALEVNCENMQALLGVVQLGFSLNKLPEMEAAILKFLDYNPVNLSLMYSLAGCYYRQGKTVEAEGECRKILLFEPENVFALELLEKIKTDAGLASSAAP